MKPFTKCPSCQAPFTRISYNINWLEESCSNYGCQTQYRQYFPKSWDDPNLSYIQFKTKDFFAYFYYDHHSYHNRAHIYHNVFPKGESVQSPAFKIPAFEVNFDKLNDLNKRWKLWTILS